MRLTSQLARQKALNPVVQGGLQSRGSMGDRSTGITQGLPPPPPAPRAGNPQVPDPAAPQSRTSGPAQPLLGRVQPSIQAQAQPTWRPGQGVPAAPSTPRAPSTYQVTPTGGQPPPAHRQVTDQGNLTGSQGWRSTGTGTPVSQLAGPGRYGMPTQNLGAPGSSFGTPGAGGTVQTGMQRGPDHAAVAEAYARMMQGPVTDTRGTGATGATFSTLPPGGTGSGSAGGNGNTGGIGRTSSNLTADTSPEEQPPPPPQGNIDPSADTNALFDRWRRGENLSAEEMAQLRAGALMGDSGFEVDANGNINGGDDGNIYDPSSWSEETKRRLADYNMDTDTPDSSHTQGGFDTRADLARSLGVTEAEVQSLMEAGYSFHMGQDGQIYVDKYEGPNESRVDPMAWEDFLQSPSYRALQGTGGIPAATNGIDELLKQAWDLGVPGFDPQILEQNIQATRRNANMQNAQSVAAAMQMAANAGVAPETGMSLVADAGQRMSVALAANEAQQRFSAEIQNIQAKMAQYSQRMDILKLAYATAQSKEAQEKVLDNMKEMAAYQAQLQQEMMAAQAGAANAANLGRILGTVGGALIGGLATAATGGAAAPLVPALSAAGGAMGGAVGGAYADTTVDPYQYAAMRNRGAGEL